MEDIVIISRHLGAIAWLEELGFVGIPVIQDDATPDDVRGRWVVGNVPLGLASLAKGVLAIEFAGTPPRGREYGPDDMRAAGARLAAYFVSRSRSTAEIAQGCGSLGGEPTVPAVIRPWVQPFSIQPSDCMGGKEGYEARTA